MAKGKSKYQIKAQKTLETVSKSPTKGRPKYYDEEFLEKKRNPPVKSTGAAGTAIIISLIVVASVVGILAYVDSQKPEDEQQWDIPNFFGDDDDDGETIKTVEIEDGDHAEIFYKLWADTDRDGYIDQNANPYQENTFDTDVKIDNLIRGFYYNLLGMKKGEEKTFQLPANIDANGDNIDDVTGEEVLSYGNPEATLYNMKLIFYIKIVSITKQ